MHTGMGAVTGMGVPTLLAMRVAFNIRFQWPSFEKWYMKIHIGHSQILIDDSIA